MLVDDGLPRNYVGREDEDDEEEGEGEGAVVVVVVDNPIRHNAIRKVNGNYVI